MLTELVVEGLGAISTAEVTLGRGCTALTGETGAGKTLLVTALGLLVGARSDKATVRAHADRARVEGHFLLADDHPVVSACRAEGLVGDENEIEGGTEIVVSRTVTKDGRSKARINGTLVPVSLLESVGGSLVEITGQHSHHRLLTGAAQRELLDHFAGSKARDEARRVRELVADLRDLAARIETLESNERERARELDVLTYEIAEIERAKLRPAERDELRAMAHRLEHAEAIATAVQDASEALTGDRGLQELTENARAALQAAAAGDPAFETFADRMTTIGFELADIAQELRSHHVEPDPEALSQVQDRIAELGRLFRKYGDDEVQVLEYLARARARAEELHGAANDGERLSAELDERRAEASAAAARLSTLRGDAAVRLQDAVQGLLGDLAMADARFSVALEETELTEHGTEDVSFLLATSPAEPLKPLGKIASGGELSRVALAVHLVTSSGTAPTMVFDEVDAGVGGAAARSIGTALASLRDRVAQVLVVTHLPQVAAFADRQLLVSKGHDAGRPITEVAEVAGKERVDELSRMLAGMPESLRAQEHAVELLSMAEGAKGS